MSVSKRAESIWGEGKGHPYVEIPPFPKNMLIELSNGCNHACVFCANPLMERKVGRINKDLLERVMREARQLGTEEIGFYTTGEPLVHKNLEDFTEQASTLGFKYIYISTNGAMGTPARFKKLIDAGMNSIKFSINAGSRESYKQVHGKDDWDKVLENLKFVADYRKQEKKNIKLYASFIISKNVEHEIELYKKVIGPFVDEIYFVPCGNQTGNMSAAMTLLTPDTPVSRGDADNVCPLPYYFRGSMEM